MDIVPTNPSDIRMINRKNNNQLHNASSLGLTSCHGSPGCPLSSHANWPLHYFAILIGDGRRPERGTVERECVKCLRHDSLIAANQVLRGLCNEGNWFRRRIYIANFAIFPTIYTCAKNREVSVSRNFAIFWLVVRMCDHRLQKPLQCMHSCMQRMQYAWGPRISIHVSKSARS